jgi:ABC-type Fe3+-citrate transport system substrate-binding protein
MSFPQRIVSLVPSLTESLFDLGLGNRVVGITDYCIHPKEKLAHLHRVGGPKTVRLDSVLELKPDLVLANKEENSRDQIEELRQKGVDVFLEFPRTVNEMIASLWELLEVLQTNQGEETLRLLERMVEWAEVASHDKVKTRYFCPIWHGTLENRTPWWMTFNQETYANDVLRILGGENVFAIKDRHYPLSADLGEVEAEDAGERDMRYPCVSAQEVVGSSPEAILWLDEPFSFTEADENQMEEIFRRETDHFNHRMIKMPGSFVLWSGTRLIRTLTDFGDIFIQ